MINAGIGIPDVEAPQAIKECLARYVKEKNSTYGYPVDVHPYRGITELIEAIIEDYRKIRRQNVSGKYGGTSWTRDALHLIRLFRQGKVLIPDPVYPAYESATLLAYSSIERVKTSRESGWRPEFKFTGNEVALYFCDPNNPTGAVGDPIIIAFSLKR